MKPELLLPAGDYEKLKTAFQYGADAVYIGVPMLSLRARENKFDIETVRRAVQYARSLGKTIYLTVNIYPRNVKIPLLEKALKQMAQLQPDGFIVADAGVIMLCKELAPKVPLHLSVQANNVNWASAQFWHKQGVSRIILSREISLKEIKEIHEKNPKLELEFFVHGSICIAYSGRCLLSQYLSNRDANQGVCSQSCRWAYKLHSVPQVTQDYYLEENERPGQYMKITEDENGAYIMNSKDMCLIEHLKDLRDAGVCSFKIEGRNKTIYYVATVARAYRRAIDDMEAEKPFDKELLKEVAKTSNRGFIPGFLAGAGPGEAQDYKKTSGRNTHEFIGVVRAISEKAGKKMYELEVKGRMDAPAQCEVMTPEKDFECTLKEFLTADGRAHKTVHPGQADTVFVDLPEPCCVGAILRMPRLPKQIST